MKLFVVVVVVAGLLLTSAVLFFNQPEDLEFAVEQVYGTPTTTESSFAESGDATLILSDSVTVAVPPGLSGVVVELYVSEGSVVEHGSAVMNVNGNHISAFRSENPFWRPLKSGDKGPDVAALQCGLVELGHLPAGSCDGVFGSATAKAVTAYNQSNANLGESTFDHLNTVWLSEDALVVGSVGVSQGMLVSAGTEPLITSTARITGLVFSRQSGQQQIDDEFGSLHFLPSLINTAVPIDRQDLTGDVSSLSAEALASLQTGAEALEGVLNVSGRLEGSVTVSRLTIPTSAIVESTSGMCVLVEDVGLVQPVPISVVGSTIGGASHIAGALSENSNVLLNPEVLETATC